MQYASLKMLTEQVDELQRAFQVCRSETLADLVPPRAPPCSRSRLPINELIVMFRYPTTTSFTYSTSSNSSSRSSTPVAHRAAAANPMQNLLKDMAGREGVR